MGPGEEHFSKHFSNRGLRKVPLSNNGEVFATLFKPVRVYGVKLSDKMLQTAALLGDFGCAEADGNTRV